MHSRARCLIVDDDPQFLSFAVELLRVICPRLQAIEMSDSLDALEFLRTNRVDVIITDYHMPFVDGLRLTAAVRSIDRDVPIIMISGDDVRAAALAAGVSACVAKSAFAMELGDTIERLGVTRQRRQVSAEPALVEKRHSGLARR